MGDLLCLRVDLENMSTFLDNILKQHMESSRSYIKDSIGFTTKIKITSSIIKGKFFSNVGCWIIIK